MQNTRIDDDLDRKIRAAKLADPDVNKQLAADFVAQSAARKRP